MTVHSSRQKKQDQALPGRSAAACILALAQLTLWLGVPLPAPAVAQGGAAREVLVLSSYHAGFAWDDGIKQAITDVLEPEKNPLELHFEYMDTKRINDAAYVRMLHDLYRHKYRGTTLSVIIASDNFAFDFLRDYRDELFPGVPVVFCGVNFYQDEMLAGRSLFTGAAEEFDAAATVDILLRLHPATRALFVLDDADLTGQAWANDIRKQIAGRYPKLEVTYAEPMTKAQAVARVKALPPDAVVLLGVFLRDAAGAYLSAPDFARQLAAASPVPVYGLLDLYMGYGIVGGAMIDGYHQGELAARLARRVLEGEPADGIPVIKRGVTRPMFDYLQLARFGIRESALPPNSVIINQPRSFYREHKGKLLAAAAFFVAASSLILFLAFTLLARRKAERQLRDSQERLALTLESVNEGVWDWDVRTGEMICSPRCYTMLDYQPHQVPRTFAGWRGLLHPDDVERADRRIRQHFDQGDTYAVELRMRDGTGAWRWVLVRGMVVARDAAGKPLRMVGTHTDITARKQVEVALKASEERYRVLLESMGEGLVVIDREARVTYANQQFRAMTGCSAEELQGRPFESLMGDGARAIFRAQFEQRHQGHAEPYELEFSRKGGGVVSGLLLPRPLYDDEGRFSGSFAAISDITERKRAESQLLTYRDHLEDLVKERTIDLESAKSAAETANRAKSTFLANMSHELRTPLNAILGFSQIMAKDRAATPAQGQHLAVILKSGEHLLTLINSVLDLARIESGKIQLEIEEFDLGQLIEELISMLRGRAEAKGLQLSLDQSSSFPRFIKSDPAKLRQILVNLLGNAIKFTEHGQVSLKLAVIALNHGTDRLQLAFDVTDTGPGIAPGDVERLFRPFEQARRGSFTEGTGLGLAIAREYINLLCGSIGVTSAPGEGSTFHFTIACEAVEASRIPQIHQGLGEISAIDNARACKILLVEDHLENRLLVREMLAPYGFQHREAVNGEEGVAAAREWRPHCILMDRRMPVMDGIAATRAIRRLDLVPQPAIIGVTAHAYKAEQAEMCAAGCSDFLAKPFKEGDLLNLLAKHLPITIVRAAPPGEEPEPAGSPDLPTILAALPEATLGHLQKAAILGDPEEILALLAPHPEARRVLEPVVAQYRFDFLIDEVGKVLAAEPAA